MITDFLVPFIAVGLAELGDKTQLAVFCLSSKTKEYTRLIFGVMLAFILADGLAILLGDILTKFIPTMYIKIIAGLIFLIVGGFILWDAFKGKDEDEIVCKLKTPFLSGFGLVFISEMGDKTQIAAGIFATQYNPYMVFLGVILALFLLSLMAVFLGKIIFSKFKKKTISIISGAIFVVIGIVTLVGL